MTAGPILAIALGIGLLIGLIQAATSIQEMTLSFVPKVFVVMASLALLAPYTLNSLTVISDLFLKKLRRKGCRCHKPSLFPLWNYRVS